MKRRYFHTTGKRDISFYENLDFLPLLKPDEIVVKTILCGVCRSDIAAFAGWELPMPWLNQGHEGLGEVVQIGSAITNVKVGDIVSTWSDPAYADYYIASSNQYVQVPEVDKKYILQPTACAINIGQKSLDQYYVKNNRISKPSIILLGSGFMSIVLYQYFKFLGFGVVVVGSSLKEIWNKFGVELKTIGDVEPGFDIVIDLTSKAENFDSCVEVCNVEGILCYASTPFTPVTTNFFDACWKCITIIMPSPRNTDFNSVMETTKEFIKYGRIIVDDIWTNEYARNDVNEVKRAFFDGMHRDSNYVRGYINWTK